MNFLISSLNFQTISTCSGSVTITFSISSYTMTCVNSSAPKYFFTTLSACDKLPSFTVSAILRLYSGNPLYPQKAKFFILTYLLFQGIIGLPSRSWLSLLSLDIPIFSRLSPWLDTKEKDLIERFFRSTRSLFSRYFIHSLCYRFLPFEDKRDCLGIVALIYYSNSQSLV